MSFCITLSYFKSFKMREIPWWANGWNSMFIADDRGSILGWKTKIQKPQGMAKNKGTSLVVQWLRHSTPNTGIQGLIPDQETRSQISQPKIPHATTETWHS